MESVAGRASFSDPGQIIFGKTRDLVQASILVYTNGELIQPALGNADRSSLALAFAS